MVAKGSLLHCSRAKVGKQQLFDHLDQMKRRAQKVWWYNSGREPPDAAPPWTVACAVLYLSGSISAHGQTGSQCPLNDGPREHVVHATGWDGAMAVPIPLEASSESGVLLGDR